MEPSQDGGQIEQKNSGNNFMSWNVLDNECFDTLLNNPSFSITEHGPLCGPITRFEVRRDENQKLLLTTHSQENSTRNITQFPESIAGTVRANNDCVTLSNGRMTAIAKGVLSFSTHSKTNYIADTFDKEETASLHSIDCMPADMGEVHYQIEWVNNIDTSFYILPHLWKEEQKTSITRTLRGGEEPLIQHMTNNSGYNSRGCLRLKIAEHEIYIGLSPSHQEVTPRGSGFILYREFVPEDVRQKIRNCLSFAFGLPLIYAGYTLLSSDFHVKGFRAVTPYSFDGKAYTLHAQPAAPVSEKSSNFIDAAVFSKTVNALFHRYDELNLSHIDWLYWHARCAPLHIIAVHLGACIEAIQTSYRKLYPNKYKTQLLEAVAAKSLHKEYLKLVEAMTINDSEKEALRQKASSLNETPQSLRNERFFDSLSLQMAKPEKDAWKRRNDAAHGNKTEVDDYEQLIRDIKLLTNILHRVVLTTGQVSEQYIDYYSLMYPIRRVNESVEAPNNGKFFAL
ncbi:MAG: hypothetical protein ABIR76_10055 [Polaromonas sp.]